MSQTPSAPSAPFADRITDPVVRQIVDMMSAVFPKFGTEVLDAAEGRALLAAAPKSPAPVVEVAGVTDRTIPGPGGELAVRIYRPAGSKDGDVLPVVVFFHGGGWVVCDLDSHDQTIRTLANATGAVYVSVDYRRAPETPFPGPAEDAYTAYLWARDNALSFGGDASRIAVAGDSAGGNLAAATCLMLRDRGEAQPQFQLLLYPVTDYRCDSLSYSENGEGYFLTATHMRYFWKCYVGADAPVHSYASVVDAPDHSGLAPAHLVAAGLDPLRDDAVAYAKKLADAGVPVTYGVYDQMFHGSISMGAVVPDAAAAFDGAVKALRTALA